MMFKRHLRDPTGSCGLSVSGFGRPTAFDLRTQVLAQLVRAYPGAIGNELERRRIEDAAHWTGTRLNPE